MKKPCQAVKKLHFFKTPSNVRSPEKAKQLSRSTEIIYNSFYTVFFLHFETTRTIINTSVIISYKNEIISQNDCKLFLLG